MGLARNLRRTAVGTSPDCALAESIAPSKNGAMGWDAKDARRYAEVSACLGKLAAAESDARLKNLLLSMSSDCETLAGYFHASDETAALRCAGVGIAETEERLQANRDVNAILMRLQQQWEILAAELDKGAVRQADPAKT